jgi:hypothetical protein
MVQSKFNLVFWFVSYNILLQVETIGPTCRALDGSLSLPHSSHGPCAMQVADERHRVENGGRRAIASEGGVPAAGHFHSKALFSS